MGRRSFGRTSVERNDIEKVLMIEPKGVNAFQWPNRLGIYMAANAKWVVAASHDERRFRCLKNENCSVDIGLGHCLREV
jgi:hypothetical protein